MGASRSYLYTKREVTRIETSHTRDKCDVVATSFLFVAAQKRFTPRHIPVTAPNSRESRANCVRTRKSEHTTQRRTRVERPQKHARIAIFTYSFCSGSVFCILTTLHSNQRQRRGVSRIPFEGILYNPLHLRSVMCAGQKKARASIVAAFSRPGRCAITGR